MCTTLVFVWSPRGKIVNKLSELMNPMVASNWCDKNQITLDLFKRSKPGLEFWGESENTFWQKFLPVELQESQVDSCKIKFKTHSLITGKSSDSWRYHGLVIYREDTYRKKVVFYLSALNPEAEMASEVSRRRYDLDKPENITGHYRQSNRTTWKNSVFRITRKPLELG